MSSTKRKPLEKQEAIPEYFKRLRKEAIELSKQHVDVKPIKFMLK